MFWDLINNILFQKKVESHLEIGNDNESSECQTSCDLQEFHSNLQNFKADLPRPLENETHHNPTLITHTPDLAAEPETVDLHDLDTKPNMLHSEIQQINTASLPLSQPRIINSDVPV